LQFLFKKKNINQSN